MAIDIKEDYPIDAVVLWVDGYEEDHRLKMIPFLDNKESLQTKLYKNRFTQINEIEFSINSLIKNAPFLRNIFIITDNQVPNFLKSENLNPKYNKVKIIDHKEIFKDYEQFLPTFNSRSIETFIFRIPNLAEHFIYLNDDFFIINNTTPKDFFSNGYPLLRGKWKNTNNSSYFEKYKKPKLGHKSSQIKGAKLVGFDKYYNFKHTPHPFRKSTFEQLFNSQRELLLSNVSYKFRNNDQFLIQSLINHTEIKNKTCVLHNNTQLLYFRTFKKPLIWYKFYFILKTNDKLFLTLQSLYLAPKPILNYILNWMQIRLKS